MIKSGLLLKPYMIGLLDMLLKIQLTIKKDGIYLVNARKEYLRIRQPIVWPKC